MLSDLAIYRAAQAIIQAYGAGAVVHAAQRAYELMRLAYHRGVTQRT